LEKTIMTRFLGSCAKLVRDEEGASLAEYGLLLALIAVICVGAIAVLGTNISQMFTNMAGAI